METELIVPGAANCASCSAMPGFPHAPSCPAAAFERRRRHESYTVVLNGHPVLLAADLVPGGWRPSWSGFGKSSRELPHGGLEENRHSSAEGALVAAFVAAIPLLRLMGGSQ